MAVSLDFKPKKRYNICSMPCLYGSDPTLFMEVITMAKPFIVETSARHIHVSKEDLAILFGADAKLTNKKIFLSPVSSLALKELPSLAPKAR